MRTYQGVVTIGATLPILQMRAYMTTSLLNQSVFMLDQYPTDAVCMCRLDLVSRRQAPRHDGGDGTVSAANLGLRSARIWEVTLQSAGT